MKSICIDPSRFLYRMMSDKFDLRGVELYEIK